MLSMSSSRLNETLGIKRSTDSVNSYIAPGAEVDRVIGMAKSTVV